MCSSCGHPYQLANQTLFLCSDMLDNNWQKWEPIYLLSQPISKDVQATL